MNLELRWWDKKRLRALELVMAGELNTVDIAADLGIHRRTLEKWTEHEYFEKKKTEMLAEQESEIRAQGIRLKDNRYKFLQDRHDRMYRIIRERAAEDEVDPTTKLPIAGWKSGLLVRDYKGLGGNAGLANRVYKFDAALDKALRETEKQMAIEAGEWVEQQSMDMTARADQSTVELLRVLYGSGETEKTNETSDGHGEGEAEDLVEKTD